MYLKKVFVAVIFSAFAVAAMAQETPFVSVSSSSPAVEDVLFVLERNGYIFHNITVPAGLNAYDVDIVMDEYEEGEFVNSHTRGLSPTWRKTIYPGETDVREVGWDELMVIFNTGASGTGSEVMYRTSLDKVYMPLEPRKDKGRLYRSAAFEDGKLETGVKIPVLVFGHAWLDEESNVYRFCTPKNIESDMSDRFFELSPHYYIVSLLLTENGGEIIDLNREE